MSIVQFIECDCCGRHLAFKQVPTKRAHVARHYLTKLGWMCGLRRGYDFCWSCAEKRRPKDFDADQQREALPPHVLADAKHDTVHEQSGKARPGTTAQRREME